MPSFDVVSEFDAHEATNAVDQANREVSARFDFKGVNASFEMQQATIELTAETDFQLKQMLDILTNKLAKRGVDVLHLQVQDPVLQHKSATQRVTLQQGIDQDQAKKIVKIIKDHKMKVQAAIQGDKVRVTGKKRDDLQQAIALLREQPLKLPLQFTNFRD